MTHRRENYRWIDACSSNKANYQKNIPQIWFTKRGLDKIVSFIVLILYISHIFFLADYTFFPGLKYWILFALVAARRWWKTRSQSWNLSAVFLAFRQRCVWSKQEPVGHSPPTHPHHVFWDSDRQKMKTTPNCHILSTLANAKKEKTRARATLLYMQRVCQWFFCNSIPVQEARIS